MSKSLYFTSPDKEKTVMELLRERDITYRLHAAASEAAANAK